MPPAVFWAAPEVFWAAPPEVFWVCAARGALSLGLRVVGLSVGDCAARGALGFGFRVEALFFI